MLITKSGAGIAFGLTPASDAALMCLVGTADDGTDLEAKIYVTETKLNPTDSAPGSLPGDAVEVLHIKAPKKTTVVVPIPGGILCSSVILVNFIDSGTAHEVFAITK